MTNYYRIIVKGALDSRWADWFDGFVLDLVSVNETVLSGPVQDQAALHGILAKVRDLGLTLLSVQMLEKQEEIDNSNGVRHVNKISGPSL
jgi:hypothetical protein